MKPFYRAYQLAVCFSHSWPKPNQNSTHCKQKDWIDICFKRSHLVSNTKMQNIRIGQQSTNPLYQVKVTFSNLEQSCREYIHSVIQSSMDKTESGNSFTKHARKHKSLLGWPRFCESARFCNIHKMQYFQAPAMFHLENVRQLLNCGRLSWDGSKCAKLK